MADSAPSDARARVGAESAPDHAPARGAESAPTPAQARRRADTAPMPAQARGGAESAPTDGQRGGAGEVYNRIAMLRVERGISRRQLAEALGVHYQTVGYLERGEFAPSLHLALRLARFFGVPVEVIFSIEPFPRLGEPEAK